VSAPLAPAEPEEEVFLLPVSYAQRRLWFVDRLEPGSPLYNIPLAWRLRGPLDPAALAAALAGLTARHEVLRTTFEVEEGEPVQVIAPPRALPLPEIDLAGLPAAPREAEARRLLTGEASRPFDLERGPLFRAALLRLAEGDHVLLASLHHIVADGGSLPILQRDLSALYGAALAGTPALLPGLPIQYADFAVWQREHLAGEGLERQLDYWRRQLGDAPQIQEIPLAGPRPAARSHRGAARSRMLPESAAAGLDALARQEGATRFMVLLAAFQALLFRLTPESGRSDVVVGTPIDNRGQEETEGLIGLFVNTLALRADLAGRPAFRELVGRVRQVALEAYAHQDLPFERLVEELRPERDLSHDPLVQVVFSVQEKGTEGLRLAGVEAEPLEIHHGRAKLDLALLVETAGRSWRVRTDAAADLFSSAALDRLLASFVALAAGAAADPGCPVTELALLTEEARHQLLLEWNDTRPPLAQEEEPAAIHRWVAAWAEQTPSAPALIAEREEISYGELDRRANRLAHHLLSLGVERGSRVAVALRHAPERVVVLLGVLKAGGAYVSLDPLDPPERRAWVLADCGARVLITEGSLPGLDHLPSHDPGVETGGEDLAYVIYTSGSTGRPKGVEIPHRGLLNLVRWHRRVYGVTPGDRAAQMAGEGFDASVWELWPYLASGAAVCFPPEAARANPSALVPWLVRAGITLCFLPTPVAELALDEAWPAEMCLRALLTGGDRLRRRPGPEHGFRLINHYGPTENSVVATWSAVTAGEAADLPPIGRPVDGAQVYLLDPGGREVPLGAAGELCIGGASLARGYLGRPELTAERFVPDPWSAGSAGPGARLYRTGDLARHRPDGEIEFLGRIDQQVKIRGVRIELGEIEAILSSHPGVRESAVVVREDGSGRRLLAACVVSAAESGGIAPEALRLWLRERLPETMVPAVFLPFEALPLTSNGKVDRRALLRVPLPDEAPDRAGSIAPRSATEELLAGIWAAVLGRSTVGVRDDFFELGGHSLLATQVASRVRGVFGIELPLRLLFEAPTVAGLAERVEALRRGGGEEPAPPIVPVPRDGELPASFSQERLWFLDQLGEAGAAYNLPAGLRLRGALSVPALAAALGEIVRRHEALRTTFTPAPGDDARVLQVVAPDLLLPLPVIDLAEIPGTQRSAEAARLATAAAREPFDLTRGPLLRTVLLRLGADEHLLVLLMHHIVSDGWSLGIFLRELARLYEAFAAGRPSPLAAPAVHYADFASWQRAWLRGEVLEGQLAWWRERLTGLPPLLELAADRPRPPVQGSRGGRLDEPLGAALSQALAALCRREGATPFMVLLAGFQALLGRWSGREDPPVGTPVANRNRTETEGVIGFFVNTLVLRADLSGDPSFTGLLRRVRETTLDAWARQDLPFEKLVEDLRPQRDLSHAPLFQVMLVFQNMPLAPPVIQGLEMTPLPVETGTAKLDLTLAVVERGEGVRLLQAEFNRDLFDGATVARLLGHLAGLLTEAVADPGRRLSGLPLLSETERHQTLTEWNDTEAGFPPGLCLHDLVRAQAERTPEATAVVCGGERATHRELDRRANQLAHRLRALGIGREVPVGIALERSIDMVVALLAILKAGGAYVPLDPSYPPDRLAFLLADSQREIEAPVLVTRERLLPLLPRSAGGRPVRTVCLDRDREAIDRESEADPAAGAGPEDLAYIIYTSGSTGRPKGVAIEHRSAAALLAWAAGVFPPEDLAGVLASTSINFDLSVFELFLPLARGGTVILAENALALAGLPEAGAVTLVNTVPSALAELLRLEALPASVRTVNLAGEPLTPALVEQIERLPGVRRVLDLYGPSEDTTYSTWARRTADGPATIGRPIAGTRAYLFDRGGSPVPLGVPGEIWLGGDGLARGYLHRPELTAERFVPDPFAGVSGGSGAMGSRLYRTGDLARFRGDGRLELLGRIDHQVKIRGFRIELGEIEAQLCRHPGVQEAAVVVREAVSGDRRLAAWVVLAEGASCGPGDLQGWLAERLPAAMLPSSFGFLEELPRLPNGKVDRRDLSVRGGGGEEGRKEGFTPPATEEELRMAAIWTEVLGVPRVGLHDDFFRLGGHSLLVARVIARLRRDFQVDLPLRSLFQAPTVAGLLELVRQAGQRGQPAPAPRISTLSRSAGQLRSRSSLDNKEDP
jgi:amino acid adenylation domain-containing protein